ncbi:hypothetical protein [Undibacterium sp. WLHG33]|uniref:hypothetical protein n=1 Tax=Undibacterium sp. WLHG33 TaxID=3412482 RepID=UPI003C2E4834
MSASYPYRHRRSSHWLLCLLLPALLLAQWVSLSHKLAHAGWPSGKAQVTALSTSYTFWQVTSDSDERALHSCALFDATVAADYLDACVPALSLLRASDFINAFAASTIWLASIQLPFSSRAPPFLKH